MLKRFFSKTKITFITILSLLSLVSVGFASWTITALDVEEEVSVSLESDIVINSKEYVYLDTEKGDNKTGIKNMQYQDYGYLDSENYVIVDTGYVYNYFILDLEKCSELLKNDFDSVEVILRLGYADTILTSLNLFENNAGEFDNGYHAISASYEEEELTHGVNLSIEKIDNLKEQQYSVKLKFDKIITMYENGLLKDEDGNKIDKVYFTVKYSFFATPGDYFKENIFGELYKEMVDALEFKIDVYLLGSNSTDN